MESSCGCEQNLPSTFPIKPLHGGISVADMDASIAWYQSMLGFQLVSNKFIPPLKARVAFLERDGWSLELFEHTECKPLPADRRTPNLDIQTQGFKHVAYAVEDLAAAMAELKAKGVDVAMDLFPMEGDQVAFIRDNTGNLVELIQQS
ncbi:VOC family protein [Holophaga foetida]|uniref:VOC family protein n=1 Tax=Holophaga foetida TaxID=35839 RepID=UPI0002474A0B|nr:VOC family protein [Holophaga foetida]